MTERTTKGITEPNNDDDNTLALAQQKAPIDHAQPVEQVTDQPRIQDVYPPQQGRRRARSSSLFGQFLLVLAMLMIPLISLFAYLRTNAWLDQLKQDSSQIYQQFERAAKRAIIQDFDNATAGLNQVKQQLAKLRQSVWFIQEFDQLVATADKLIAATTELTALIPKLQKLPHAFLALNQDPELIKQRQELSQGIADLISNLETIQANISTGQQAIKSIPRIALSDSQRQQVNQLESQLTALTTRLNQYQQHLPALKSFLGYDLPHRYLILLQNNNELRPGGGFIGSFIIADTNDGVVSKFDPYDVYEFDGQLVTDTPQPQELTGITSTESIRDSNTSPSLTRNTQKASQLLEAAGGPSVDTVIVLNQSVIEELLQVVGPVQLEQGTITAANFSPVFTYLIEAASLDDNQPKNQLFDFIPQFKSQLFAAEDKRGAIISTIRKAIAEKNIMAYSKQPQLQQVLTGLNLSNKLEPTSTTDELLITHTSIGGNKSDRWLKTRYIHNTELTADGQLINHLTVRLYHGYNDQIEAQIASYLRPFGVTEMIDPIRYVLGRGENITRLKIYVPKNSKITNVAGIDAAALTSKSAPDLQDRQLFSYVARLYPQDSHEVTISYQLPQELNIDPLDLYQLTLHKAPGVNQAIFEKYYQLPSQFTIAKSQPNQALLSDQDQYQHETPLKTDQLYQAIITTK